MELLKVPVPAPVDDSFFVQTRLNQELVEGDKLSSRPLGMSIVLLVPLQVCLLLTVLIEVESYNMSELGLNPIRKTVRSRGFSCVVPYYKNSECFDFVRWPSVS